MSRIYDLSHPYQHQMPVYPGDDPVVLRETRSAAKDGYTLYALQTGLPAGTHLDAPLHILSEGRMIADLPLDLFAGRGRLLDVRGEDPIRCRAEYGSFVGEDDVVLLWTGHSAAWGTAAYFQQHPPVHEELARFFVQRRIKLLGMDLPSPDGPPFLVHKTLLGAGIPQLENLTNLEQLEQLSSFEEIAFPLKICAEGCPVRAVARVLA